LWALATETIAELLVYNLLYKVPPLSLIGLTSCDNTDVGLSHHKAMFAALLVLLADAHKGKACQNFIKNLVFPQEEWTLTQMIRLAEDEFSEIRPLVMKALVGFSESFLTTLSVERTFKKVREVTRRTPSNNIRGESVWHQTWTQKCPADHRQFGADTKEGKAASVKGLPKQLFGVGDRKCSLPDEVLDGIHASSPNWPTLNGHNMRTSGFRFLVSVSVGGHWDRLQKSWQSMFLPKRAICKVDAGAEQILVLYRDACGYAGWRVNVATHAKGRQIDFGLKGADNVVVGCVEDVRTWRCVEMNCTAPNDPSCPSKSDCIQCFPCGKNEKVLEYQARVGFKGVNLTYLKKLYKELDIKVEKKDSPVTVDQYVTALVENIMGVAADAEFKKTAHAERKAFEDDVEESFLFKPENYALVADEIEEDEERREEVKALKVKYAKLRATLRPPAAPGMAAPGAAAGSSGDALPGAPPLVKKVFKTFATHGLSQKVAKMY
jgi:hypothetical protein